jgi:HlyD family secretion protein
MKRITVIASSALLLLAAGCGHKWRTPDGSGTIDATEVQVAAQVGGQLVSVLVDEGIGVASGDTIALIDPTLPRLRASAADAALSQARAQLDLALEGAREEQIAQARSAVREAQAGAALADSNYLRTENLFKRKSATRQQLDQASAARERAASALSSAEEGLTMLLRGNREQQIRAAQAQYEQAMAQAAVAGQALDDCSIVSPCDGTVTTKIRQDGETVPAGGPVVVVSELSTVWLSIYLPEPRLAEVAIGDSAWVTIDGSNKVFGGYVSYVSPEAEFTPRDVQTPAERVKLVYRVKIQLANPEGVFKPGMPADGYVGTRP